MNTQSPKPQQNPPSAFQVDMRPTVETTLSCWRCGGSLKGRSVAGACPSCGSAVAESLFQTSFLGLSISALRRIRLGSAVILFSYFGSAALFLAAQLIAIWIGRGSVLDFIDPYLMALIPACGCCIGSWILSLALINLKDREFVTAARRARIFATILPAINAAGLVINTQATFQEKWLWAISIGIIGYLVFLAWAFYALELVALACVRAGRTKAGSDMRLVFFAIILAGLFPPLMLAAIYPFLELRGVLTSLMKLPPSQRPGLAKWHLPAATQTIPAGFVCRSCHRQATARSPIDSWCVHCGTAFVESITAVPWTKAEILSLTSVENASIINPQTGVLESDSVLCSNCGYQLRGVAADDRCPECGHAVTASVIDSTVVRFESSVNKAGRGIAWFFVMLANTITVVVFGTCYSGVENDSMRLVYLLFTLICSLSTLLHMIAFLPLSFQGVGRILDGFRAIRSLPPVRGFKPKPYFATSLQFALFTTIVVSTVACVVITVMALGGNLGSQSLFNRATGALVFITLGWIAYKLPEATLWLESVKNPQPPRGGAQHAFWPVVMLVGALWFLPALPNTIRTLSALAVGLLLFWQVLRFRRALAFAGSRDEGVRTA
jgi:hypothetical protein